MGGFLSGRVKKDFVVNKKIFLTDISHRVFRQISTGFQSVFIRGSASGIYAIILLIGIFVFGVLYVKIETIILRLF